MATSPWTMLTVPMCLLLMRGNCHGSIIAQESIYLVSSLSPDVVGRLGMPSKIPNDLTCIIGSSLPADGVPPSSVAAFRDIEYGVEQFWQSTRPRCRLQGEPYIYEIPRGDDAIEKGPHMVYTLAPLWINVTTAPPVRFARALPRRWNWSRFALTLPANELKWQELGWKEADENKVIYIVSTEEPELAMDTGIPVVEKGQDSCDFEYRLRIPGTTRSWTLGFKDPRRAVEAFLKLRASHCPNSFFYIYAVRPRPDQTFPVSQRDGFPLGLEAVVTAARTWFGPSNARLLRYATLSMNILSSSLSLDEIGENLQEAKWERVHGTDVELEETLGPKEDCREPDADKKVAKHLNRFFSAIQQNKEYISMAGPQEVIRRLQLPAGDPQSLDNTACANSLQRVDFEVAPLARGAVEASSPTGTPTLTQKRPGMVEKGDCCRLRDTMAQILSQHRTLSRVSRLAPPRTDHGQEEMKACSHFSRLSLGFQLRNESLRDGTEDSIQLSIGGPLDEHVILIAKSPKPGFHMWTTLDLNDIFGRDVIAKKDLTHIGLISRMTNDDPQDGWYFQGLKLRGHCADSSLIMTLDTFASVNRWVDRPTGIRAAIVWGGTIEEDDWYASSCTQFDQLQVQFVISNLPHSHTKDDIFIHFGNTSDRTDTLLMRAPELGQATRVMIDLGKTFGRDVVPVADLRSIELYSQAPAVSELPHRGLPEGGWRSGGVSLHGRCASSRFLVAFWSANDRRYVGRLSRNETRSHGLKYDISERNWEWNRRSRSRL
ncbi:hypothetical protein L249_5581 [Ophiocordyceps polyrhachis-furcata BCC 54312]|uniref:Heat-labile enterotoxin n=1 Tax=Ophiocordyceps polyrhachis-furcata BCC 54312 TaxID=1330021 RepID=A0A367LG60_9HYPO|nr:hypothetical protein L249_5581 [Ophiocordyceps polyrhachis-furcata BCC 54312]